MQEQRAKVVAVIRDLAARLDQPASVRPPVERAEDPATVSTALREACAHQGISVEEYAAALREDGSLAELERQATTMGVVEAPDPGPYDAISRESPSGQPGDLSKPRTLPRSECPGGS
jgi:hypothetical protein